MDRDELIKKMRGRVEMCRRLAKHMQRDEQTAKTLREMADEGERDLNELLADRNEIPPPPVS